MIIRGNKTFDKVIHVSTASSYAKTEQDLIFGYYEQVVRCIICHSSNCVGECLLPRYAPGMRIGRLHVRVQRRVARVASVAGAE